MSRGKHPRVLHAEPHEIVYVEEATVVDFFARHAPVCKTVDLKFQKKMQQIEAGRIAGFAVDVLERTFQQLADGRRMLQHRLPLRPYLLPCLATLFSYVRIRTAVLRQGAKLLENVREAAKVRLCGFIPALWQRP